MDKLRVVHLTTSFGCGGLERVIANVVNYTPDEDVEHIIISLSDDLSFGYAVPDTIKLYTLNKKPGHDWGAHLRLAKILRKLKPQVMHTYNFGTIEYHMIAMLCSVKNRIHADHGLGGDSRNGDNKKRNVLRRFFALFVNHYIVVSDDLKKWVINTIKVPAKKVHFVFNGVPVQDERALLPRTKNKLNILIVARLNAIKNHRRMIDALIMASKKQPELSLHCDIVGDGDERDFLHNYVRDNNAENLVTFHGHQENVDSFLESTDLFAISSDYEAMPMTVLEAMAHSRPVICPRVGGVADFINEDDVFLIKGKCTESLSNAILHVANMNESDYEQKVRHAYLKVLKLYSAETMAEEYLKFYRNF
jgi:sugar transferase (PEP-CTERM/EpsH1 system associated)